MVRACPAPAWALGAAPRAPPPPPALGSARGAWGRRSKQAQCRVLRGQSGVQWVSDSVQRLSWKTRISCLPCGGGCGPVPPGVGVCGWVVCEGAGVSPQGRGTPKPSAARGQMGTSEPHTCWLTAGVGASFQCWALLVLPPAILSQVSGIRWPQALADSICPLVRKCSPSRGSAVATGSAAADVFVLFGEKQETDRGSSAVGVRLCPDTFCHFSEPIEN